MGTNILIMTVISFVVGLSISGQTFYTFILENLEKFGALKAIGTQGPRTRRHDPVPGDVHGSDRIRPGNRSVRRASSGSQVRLPDYSAMITFFNLGLAFVMVVSDRGDFQLLWRAQSAAD